MWTLLLVAAAYLNSSPPAHRSRVSAAARSHVSAAVRSHVEVLIVVPDLLTPSPFGKTSPQPFPSWHRVASQLAARMPNFDSQIRARVITEAELQLDSSDRADVLVAMAISDGSALESAAVRWGASALVCHRCSPAAARAEFVGKYAARHADSPAHRLVRALVPWGAQALGERVALQTGRLLDKFSSEDSIFAILLLIHRLGLRSIEVVRHDINPSWEKGPLRNAREFLNMIQCCGPQIFAALTDRVSKRAIDLLNAVDLRDQAGSYRVIVSFETPSLEDFSLCILQENNCFNCDAPILAQPRVPLLREWRGRPVDDIAAAQILIGHLDHPAAHQLASQKLPWSWKVVAGANPAYDQFPAQHQIFYPSVGSRANESTTSAESEPYKARGALWYDPIFEVETIDERLVWCKRHYRCTPRQVDPELRLPDGSSAGAWTFTTLDNGIVSLEHWTTVAAADDLSWAVLYYSGAAKAVGQSYTGALLCSPDGKWPADARDGAGLKAIEAALGECGLELFEIYGHGPPSEGRSFMWSEDNAVWMHANPPPLERIGDISISKWRKMERERLRKPE